MPSAAEPGARRGTTNIRTPCGKIQTLLKDSLQFAREGGGTCACKIETAGQAARHSGMITPPHSEVIFTAPLFLVWSRLLDRLAIWI